MADDDRLLKNPVTAARRDGEPRTTEYNVLPEFPAITEIPGTGAPARIITPENETLNLPPGADTRAGVVTEYGGGTAVQPGGSNGAPRAEFTPFGETSPLDVQPVATSPTSAVPSTIAPPDGEQPLMQVGTTQTLSTPTLTQGDNASFDSIAGNAGVIPVLPTPAAPLPPDVLYGNVAANVRANRTISTDIVNDWRPRLNALQAEQRAVAEASRLRTQVGLNIRDEVNGTMAPIDMVGARELLANKEVASRTGVAGLGVAIGAQLGQWFGLDNDNQVPQGFGGFGDYGNGVVGALINSVSDFQNRVFGIGLDTVNAVQSGVRAAATTPLDINDFVAHVNRYQTEFRRDGDSTSYYNRAGRGDDLGFSNYGRMADGRVNPLGLWGTEGSNEVSQAFRQLTLAPRSAGRDRYGRPTADAIAAQTEQITLGGASISRAALMGLGLVLDVITDPSDVVKALARFTGGATSARSLGEAVTVSQRARRTVAANELESIVSNVTTTEVAEATQAAQSAQRATATVTAPPPIPRINEVVTMPPVVPAAYYSPSNIVNDVAASNTAAPTSMRGTPEFSVRGVNEVVSDVDAAAPALRTELGATPLTNLNTVDAVVAATRNDALNLVPNVLAPVTRQSPDAIEALVAATVKLDVDTLAATLPRNVGNPTRTRLTLYNNAVETESMLPATAQPQRVYVNAPEGVVNNPAFPVSVADARPLIDEANLSGNYDSLVNRANVYLQRLAKQGYVQRVPDYSAFVVSTKNTDIAYTNLDNLVKVADGVPALRALSPDYVNLAADAPRVYRQTRLLETLSPSVQRTPDMFTELASGYAPKLPTTPTKATAKLMDAVLQAEDRYTNAAAILQRVESEVANVNVSLRNTTFNTGYLNRSGTVQRRSNGTVLRTSPTSSREKDALRALADVDGLPRIVVDAKAAAPNTYVVDSLPKDSRPLVSNGRLNVTLEELDDITQRVDDIVVNMVERGYVHFDVVDSMHVLADGSVTLSDNLNQLQRIDDVFYGVAQIDEIDEVRRVERAIVNDRLTQLRDTFDRNVYDLGNSPRYTEGMFDNALSRTVYEYDGNPSSLANANRLRYQTKYELERAAMMAKREVGESAIAREAAIKAFRDDIADVNTRQRGITQTQLRAKQRKIDDLLSRDRGQCM